ncbi:MAG: hypothetical protein OEY22_09330 [Candidatus Bathyarchaeota archaeon]|nr:hypothetical protein [Candidatus Bathyarchaeota archaeon]MDH5787368.1 hypothetical protein [Candidatus Bathyarchaeota archaeon]
MNIHYKKSLKLITLLISSLLIATVSAQIYNYMYIVGSGEITTTGLVWAIGPDAPSTASISGPTATVPMNASGGSPRNYTDCLHIVNQDAAAHSFNLTVTSSTGDADNFTEFNLVPFDESSTEQGVLSLLSTSSLTGLSIPASETWVVLFELIPIASPTAGAKVDFEVTLVYE